MARIGLSLQRVAKSLRKTVAPGVGDDIIEVWRGKNGTAPGGALLNEMGRTVRSNGAAPTANTGTEKVAAYYGRFAHTGSGMEGDFGPNTSVTGYAFVLNAGDAPDIESDDSLIVALKRQPRQTIADLGWRAETVYAVGAREQPSQSNQFGYLRIAGTVSGSTEPVWPKTKGATVADGDGAWQCEGRLPVYGVVDPGGAGSITVNYLVTAELK